jgi:hypothetical protein
MKGAVELNVSSLVCQAFCVVIHVLGEGNLLASGTDGSSKGALNTSENTPNLRCGLRIRTWLPAMGFGSRHSRAETDIVA